MSNAVRLLDIARRALSAQQLGMTVTGHNIANVNTPGYSRQRVVLEANRPMQYGFGYLGTGVEVQGIEQIRNGFIESEIRLETQSLNRWETRERIFGEMEGVFNEPSDIGLATLLSDFWDSWRELANDPQSATARERVKQTSVNLVNKFHQQHDRLRDLQGSLSQELEQEVGEVNSILRQIADLNDKIGSMNSENLTVNDYRDRRELLKEELSGYADVQVVEDTHGMAMVSLGGQILVEKTAVYELGVESRVQDELVMNDLIWARDGTALSVSNGSLKAILEMRDEDVAGMLERLDEMATILTIQVNDIHQTGYGQNGSTANPFFDPETTGAGDIALHLGILSDPSRIAAAADGSPGNGEIALQLSQLGEEKIMSGDTVTVEDYFAAMMGTLGVSSQEAQFMHENEVLMVERLRSEQSSVAGVSLDEEMTNLIKYQQAYEAAAKLVSMVDEMMQTLVEMI